MPDTTTDCTHGESSAKVAEDHPGATNAKKKLTSMSNCSAVLDSPGIAGMVSVSHDGFLVDLYDQEMKGETREEEECPAKQILVTAVTT